MKRLFYLAQHIVPILENKKRYYIIKSSLPEKSDVISLYSPLFDSTKGIINKNNIAKMKGGVSLSMHLVVL